MNQSIKISQLDDIEKPDFSSSIPMVTLEDGGILTTGTTTIETLRETINIANGFATLSAGLSGTVSGQTFHVYNDASEYTASQYVRTDFGANVVLGGDSLPLVIYTGKLLGSVTIGLGSIADLRLFKPWYEGQRISIESYYGDGSSLGGGEFIGHLGTATDDNGIVIAGTGFYWSRVWEGKVNVLWFGADPSFDITTKLGKDSTQAMKDAIAFAILNRYRNVYAPGGTYLVSDEINLGGVGFVSGEGDRDFWKGNYRGVDFEGDGNYSTIVVFKAASPTSVCFSFRGGWGTHSPRALSNLAIEPYTLADYTVVASGIAILLQGCCYVPVVDVNIGRFAVGVQFLNALQGVNDTANAFTSGDFTEFNRFVRVKIFNCDIALEFKVVLGNNSFRGNHFDQVMIQINPYGGMGIKAWDDGSRDAVIPPNGNYQHICNVYQNHFDINFGGSNSQKCYMVWLKNAQVVQATGPMAAEGAVTLHTEDFSWFQSYGTIQSYSSAINSEVGVTDLSTRPVAFIWNNAQYPQPFFDGLDPLLNVASYPRIFDQTNAGVTAPEVLNVRGVQSGMVFSQLASTVSVGWVFSTRTTSIGRVGQRTVFQFSYDGTKINAPSAASVGLYNSTVGFDLTAVAMVPSANTLNFGASSQRWATGFFGGWNIGQGGLVPAVNNNVNIGSATFNVNRSYITQRYWSATVFDSAGTGSPEGVLAASPGSEYRRTDGAVGTFKYQKQTGTGNTGWVAIA